MTSDIDKGRARQAKGSVQEAIGKLIGDPGAARRGASESEAGVRDIEAADGKAGRSPTRSSPDPKADPGPASGARRTGQTDGED